MPWETKLKFEFSVGINNVCRFLFRSPKAHRQSSLSDILPVDHQSTNFYGLQRQQLTTRSIASAHEERQLLRQLRSIHLSRGEQQRTGHQKMHQGIIFLLPNSIPSLLIICIHLTLYFQLFSLAYWLIKISDLLWGSSCTSWSVEA